MSDSESEDLFNLFRPGPTAWWNKHTPSSSQSSSSAPSGTATQPGTTLHSTCTQGPSSPLGAAQGTSLAPSSHDVDYWTLNLDQQDVPGTPEHPEQAEQAAPVPAEQTQSGEVPGDPDDLIQLLFADPPGPRLPTPPSDTDSEYAARREARTHKQNAMWIGQNILHYAVGGKYKQFFEDRVVYIAIVLSWNSSLYYYIRILGPSTPELGLGL